MEKQILYNSDQSAIYEERKIKGWWSVKSTHHKSSVFWGEDEHMARWDGCTHKICDECGKHTHEKQYTCCTECRARHERERYEKLELIEWDGKTPLCIYHDDTYFTSMDDIYSHCEEFECEPKGLMLVLCERVTPMSLDPENLLCDQLSGTDLGIPDEIYRAADEFNELVKEFFPELWEAGDKRVKVGE